MPTEGAAVRAAAALALVLIVPLVAASCHAAGKSAPIVRPGAPGEASRTITAQKAADLSGVGHTPADVRFMQGMIGHHAQAVEMIELVRARSRRDEMRLLAQRIQLSQADEITMMQRWLQRRGEQAPSEHAHHAPGATLMPGMLSPEEMDRLTTATGDEFDRLFLELMIKHHDGALTMVMDLFTNPGAGQESEIFAFASDVDADQRIEIDRMSTMLSELKK
jgi:uncharacterized protein (DUF305 family)